ncbi:MAG: carboxypeptidase-like regulatory domain-containing protein [Chitinophagaceae bacterium]|nr:carboxypeptidase-like regulatory domain-containing protein [Chitinophagaceae bacterium]
MKKTKLVLAAIVILAAGLFAFDFIDNGSIKGTVSPADAGTRAWAISDTDTLNTAVSDGAFEIKDVKPGTYQVIIEAKEPYKNATKEGVEVKDGQPTDLGEITLEQQ